MQSDRVLFLVFFTLLAVTAWPSYALDMKNTEGRAIPRVADEWDSRWAAETAQMISTYRQKQISKTSFAGFILAVVFVFTLLVLLALKFRIWEMHSTLVNLNTLGNGWQLKWAARWGAF